MCGRFVYIPKDELSRIIQQVKDNLKALETVKVSAKYEDAFPESTVPIIIPQGNQLKVAAMQWGYPKSWEKGVVFNTRADTALSSKRNMWTESLQQRRCIVPSYGFYEPHQTETTISPKTGRNIKQQYFFTLPNMPVLMMAGIYEDGRFSIMTTNPNRWIQPIHNRMPVVLLPGEYDQWLHGDYTTLFDRSDMVLENRPA